MSQAATTTEIPAARQPWWSVLGWAAYLACSWTWCIGMFLPVLLVRDYGVWGFVVFAVPNVVGAGAMGWVLSAASAEGKCGGASHGDSIFLARDGGIPNLFCVLVGVIHGQRAGAYLVVCCVHHHAALLRDCGIQEPKRRLWASCCRRFRLGCLLRSRHRKVFHGLSVLQRRERRGRVVGFTVRKVWRCCSYLEA